MQSSAVSFYVTQCNVSVVIQRVPNSQTQCVHTAADATIICYGKYERANQNLQICIKDRKKEKREMRKKSRIGRFVHRLQRGTAGDSLHSYQS